MQHAMRADGTLPDAAEKWLAENDPQRSKTRCAWRSPKTDLLVRVLTTEAELLTHCEPTLQVQLHDSNGPREGCYRTKAAEQDD